MRERYPVVSQSLLLAASEAQPIAQGTRSVRTTTTTMALKMPTRSPNRPLSGGEIAAERGIDVRRNFEREVGGRFWRRELESILELAGTVEWSDKGGQLAQMLAAYLREEFERKRALAAILQPSAVMRYSEHFVNNGQEIVIVNVFPSA